MDFHFYQSPQNTSDKVRFLKVSLSFLPLFIVAALLPVFLGLVKNPVTTRSSANADQSEFTVWIEPANVVVNHGSPVTLSVKALYEGGGKLVTGVVVPVRVDGLASIQGASVEYKKPFSGQVTLGSVVVTPQKAGVYKIYITPDQLTFQNLDNKPTVTVSEAILTVR